MRLHLTLLAFALLACPLYACGGEDLPEPQAEETRDTSQRLIPEPVRIDTLGAGDDEVFSPGEVSTGVPKVAIRAMFVNKPEICSRDVYTRWTQCWWDRFPNEEPALGLDANGEPICATFEREFECRNGRLVAQDSQCIAGLCNIEIGSPGNVRPTCGWRLETWTAWDSKGPLLEFTAEVAREITHNMIPVENN